MELIIIITYLLLKRTQLEFHTRWSAHKIIRKNTYKGILITFPATEWGLKFPRITLDDIIKSSNSAFLGREHLQDTLVVDN